MTNTQYIINEIWYCADQGDKGLFNFYKIPQAVKMCGYKDKEIISVLISQAQPNETEDAWGWFDLQEKKLVFVYPHLMLLRVCFPYGMEIEEKLGKGIALRLKVTKLTNENLVVPGTE